MKINEVEAAVGVTKKISAFMRKRTHQPPAGARQRLPQLLGGGY